MKKNLLTIALVGFLFAGLSLLGAGNQVQAQSGTLVDNLFVPPSGSFVSPTVAQELLEETCTPLKSIMLSYSQNNPEYKQAFWKYSYFNAVTNYIVNGKTVPVAIADGLKLVATDAYGIPSKKLGEYRLEIINLLKT